MVWRAPKTPKIVRGVSILLNSERASLVKVHDKLNERFPRIVNPDKPVLDTKRLASATEKRYIFDRIPDSHLKTVERTLLKISRDYNPFTARYQDPVLVTERSGQHAVYFQRRSAEFSKVSADISKFLKSINVEKDFVQARAPHLWDSDVRMSNLILIRSFAEMEKAREALEYIQSEWSAGIPVHISGLHLNRKGLEGTSIEHFSRDFPFPDLLQPTEAFEVDDINQTKPSVKRS